MLRKAIARLFAQAVCPHSESLLDGIKELLDGRVRHLPSKQEGRQLRLVQNLVGIRVADAAEKVGIGECSLERMIFTGEYFCGKSPNRRSRLPIRLDCGWPSFLHPAPRTATRAFLVPASVRMSVPLGKSNAAKPIFPGSFAWGGFPVQSAGNHQMQDEEQLGIECENQSLPQASQSSNGLAFHFLERRLKRADQERTHHAAVLERLVQHSGFETLEIDDDVGKFRAFGLPRTNSSHFESDWINSFCGPSRQSNPHIFRPGALERS